MTKTRIPWDSDSALAGGKTSIAVLLDWLSEPDNYARWRRAQSSQRSANSSSNNYNYSSRSLEPHVSKIELAREVLLVLATHGITHRLARDVRWKLNAFCASYASAALFLRESREEQQQHGRHHASGSSDRRVMDHVYSVCPYFDVLDPIMRDDPEMLLASTARSGKMKRAFAERDSDDDVRNDHEEDESESSGHSSFESVDELSQTRLEADSTAIGDHEEKRARSLQRRFKKRRHELLLENLAIENERKRVKLEREKLKMTAQIVLGRKQLLDAGVLRHEVDELFPLQSLGSDPEC